MPVTIAKRAGKFRVIEANTGKISKNRGGTAVDGGGHSSRKKATNQVRAINANTTGPRVRKRRKNLRTVRGQEIAR